MKKYKVVLAVFEDGTTNEAVDLVNIEDADDRIMAAEDEFFIGDVITEDDFYLETAPYVYDDGIGNAEFAFKVKKYDREI